MDWSQMMAKFREPFPTTQIKKRKEEYTDKAGNKKEMTFDYVDAAHVIDRLNDVGGMFEFKVLHVKEYPEEKEIITLGQLSIWNPDLGIWIRKEQQGSAQVQGKKEANGNAYKSSATDALKKCAQMFGIANHLWGGEVDFFEPVTPEPNGHADPVPPQMAQAQPVTMTPEPAPSAMATKSILWHSQQPNGASEAQIGSLDRGSKSGVLSAALTKEIRDALEATTYVLTKNTASKLVTRMKAEKAALPAQTAPVEPVTAPPVDDYVPPGDDTAPPTSTAWVFTTSAGKEAFDKIQHRKRKLFEFLGAERGERVYRNILRESACEKSNQVPDADTAATIIVALDKTINDYVNEKG